MKTIIKVSILLFIILSINSCKDNKNSDKEKELLKKEIELMKKEKEIIEKQKTTSENNETIVEKKKEIKTKTTKTNSNYIIGSRNVGKFFSGKKAPNNLPKSYLIEKKTRIEYGEGDEYKVEYFFVSENGNELLEYIMGHDYQSGKDNVITEITVTSEILKTSKGIGVNSTIENFVKAYPDYEIWYTYISDMFVIQSKSMKTQFILNEKDYAGDHNSLGKSDMDILKITDFKINSKIKSIRVL